jgi:hypothetical protein
MTKPVARTGDRTTHDGKLVGDPSTQVNIGGRPAVVVSDDHICPEEHKGKVLPTPQPPSVYVGPNQRQLACIGLDVGGGDKIIEGDTSVIVGVLGAASGAAAAATVAQNLVGAGASDAETFTPADADKLIHNRWGSLLPSSVPSDLAQRVVITVPQEEIGDRWLAVAQFAASRSGIPLTAEAKQLLVAESKKVVAFATGLNIFLPEGNENGPLVLHESLHRYTHRDWIEQVKGNPEWGDYINEGMTEMLTQQALGPSTRVYTGQVEQTRNLAGIVGQDTLERAYFSGDVEGLSQAAQRAGWSDLDSLMTDTYLREVWL